jgi:predicted RNase H-like nuclease
MLVLGIDAAWTERGSSGVALLSCSQGKRRVLKAESSYARFIGLGNISETSKSIDVDALLRQAETIGGCPVDLVAIDMPVSRIKFAGRRAADDAISVEFGNAWASTHTPNAARPGAYGERVTAAFTKAGYPLATDRLQIEAAELSSKFSRSPHLCA